MSQKSLVKPARDKLNPPTLKPEEEGEFILVTPDLEFTMPGGGRVHTVGEMMDQVGFDAEAHKGTFSAVNNGVVNFVTHDGRLFAGIATEKNLGILCLAGYVENRRWGTFLSNSELPYFRKSEPRAIETTQPVEDTIEEYGL